MLPDIIHYALWQALASEADPEQTGPSICISPGPSPSPSLGPSPSPNPGPCLGPILGPNTG